jgi:hypothetical protein
MENKAIFHLKRDTYRGDTTLGILYDPNGDVFCYVLEDVVRPYGIKDKAKTAIPATRNDDTYFFRVMPSGKYGKAVTVFTEISQDVPVLDYGGVMFSYIRCHGGNKPDDSEGCLLVNKNRDVEKMSAYGSQLKSITAKVEELTAKGYDCRLRVTNQAQEC